MRKAFVLFSMCALETGIGSDGDDELAAPSGPAVTRSGDLWSLGDHRVFCGNTLDALSYDRVLGDEPAAVVFADPPYNVKIDGNVSGKGITRHREFAMASGEMNELEFTEFLTSFLVHARERTKPGSIVYACMDWRHMFEMLSAARASNFNLLNLCVWTKTNGGMGSLYRSQHELIFVFRHGQSKHTNNIQLGRFGRNRTNVWNYAGANDLPREGGEAVVRLHPTVKPVMLIADAIRDSSHRGDIVLDSFLGSGTTILAAERIGRRGRGIEIDPLHVDTAILRWQRVSGSAAVHESGKTFAEMQVERATTP